MSRAEIQKITVLMSLNPADTNLMLAGIRLTVSFNKELKLLYVAQTNKAEQEVLPELEKYARTITVKVPGINVSFSVIIRPGKNFARIISDDLETIILVAGSSKFKELSGHLRKSPVPYLFIDEKEPFTSDFGKAIIPVDMRSQNKDSLLWAVFFGRNNHSEIIAIGANDKSKEARHDVAKHLHSLKKLLAKTNVPHKIYKGSRGSLSIQREALDTALQLNAGLLILLGSSYITWLDRLIGLPEEKIIRSAGKLPVLVVNPRRETYLVCD